MKTQIQIYEQLKEVVTFFSRQLRFDKYIAQTGRKLALTIPETIAMALFKQRNQIDTKKAVYEIFEPDCSYKTFVVSLNRWAPLGAIILTLLLKMNRTLSHPIKHIDSTDIPVCLFKNANAHKTMKGVATYGRSSKGIFYGLKLHLLADLNRKMLRVRFTDAVTDDREMVLPLTQELEGVIIGDAGYISKDLAHKLHREGRRLFLAKPRKNMKKLMTVFQHKLYDTRMLIELNFRSLKMFHKLLTSLPRSVGGYLGNYTYSLLSYAIA
jgi:hypothetical protein